MKLVTIESPFSGDIEANIEYARACMADSLRRGEFPIASHLLYTQPGILRDEIKDERDRGIAAGKAWARHADLTAVYMDRGVTPGMKIGIQDAHDNAREVEKRWLYPIFGTDCHS